MASRPRLQAIDFALLRQPENAGARIALPPLQGWHTELLDLLGYGGVERVEIDQTHSYALPRTIYSERLNGCTTFGISRSAVRTFQNLCKRARVTPVQNDAIYVARTDSLRRPMRNGQALMKALEAEGVAIIVPGLLSAVEQVALFRGARVVIGGHCGGLTNIVFCSDEAAVYELLPSHYPNPCFNRLAQAKELDYWTDMFPSDGQGHEHEQSWTVDLDLIRRRVDDIRRSVRGQGASAPLRTSGPAPVPAFRLRRAVEVLYEDGTHAPHS